MLALEEDVLAASLRDETISLKFEVCKLRSDGYKVDAFRYRIIKYFIHRSCNTSVTTVAVAAMNNHVDLIVEAALSPIESVNILFSAAQCGAEKIIAEVENLGRCLPLVQSSGTLPILKVVLKTFGFEVSECGGKTLSNAAKHHRNDIFIYLLEDPTIRSYFNKDRYTDLFRYEAFDLFAYINKHLKFTDVMQINAFQFMLPHDDPKIINEILKYCSISNGTFEILDMLYRGECSARENQTRLVLY